MSDTVPAVCFIDDLARILRTSRRTIEKLRRHRAFPIREIPAIDKRPRWAGADVEKFLASASVPAKTLRRRSA
jgi:hypothetical protein